MKTSQKPQVAPVPGGEYLAERNADGTWNIYDVPIFATHERFGFEFDRAWQEKAVATAQACARDGYIAPLHVHHHEPFASPQLGVVRAGLYLPKRVEDRQYAWSDGPVAVTIADLLQVEDHVYREIAAGKLPYLSVEIRGEEFDKGKAAFNSLALLPHEAPYFRFPLITIGAELTASEDAPVALERLAAAAPAVAFYSSPALKSALFKFGGTVKPKKPAAAKPAPKAAPKVGAYMADEMEAAKQAGIAAIQKFNETVAGLTEGLGKLASDLGLTAEAPAEGEGEAEEQPEEKPETAESAAPAEAPQAAPAPLAASAPSAHQAALELRLKVLEGELARSKREQAKATAVEAASREVAAYGAGNWGADLQAAYDAGGDAGLKAAVQIIKTSATPRPLEQFTGDLPPPNEPAEVAAYAMAGQAQLREARRMHHMWSEGPAWVRAQTPLATYIATQIGPPPSAPNTPATPGRS